MNDDVIDVTPAPDAAKLASLKQLTMINYILYAVALFTGGFTAVVAIIVNYVKRDDARGTLYESHFTWQIRTFWWSLVWLAIGWVLIFSVLLFFIGWPLLIAASLWYIYRIVKGFLNWNDGKSMEPK